MRPILLAGAVLLAIAGPAQAMEIWKFDQMSVQDQGDYFVRLIEGAQRVLIDAGRRDLADKVHRLFTEVPPGDRDTLGTVGFERNLARARLADVERLAKDPNAVRLEVEHAMSVTLNKLDIVLPKSFMHVMDNFKPKFPPKK